MRPLGEDRSGRVGAHVAGNRACDMIPELVAVMALEGGYQELAAMAAAGEAEGLAPDTAMRLARVTALDPQVLTPHEVLAMATREAADAIGRPDLGRLTPGSAADLITLSLDDPAFHPVVPGEDDLVSRLVWGASPASVHTAWVAGTRVVADGRTSTVDVAAALAEVTDAARWLAQ